MKQGNIYVSEAQSWFFTSDWDDKLRWSEFLKPIVYSINVIQNLSGNHSNYQIGFKVFAVSTFY